MADPSYDIGDQPKMRVTFTVNGVATSPSTVVGKYRKPDGTEGDLTGVVAESAGVWVATFPTLDDDGIWYGRMKGTAGVIAAAEVRFYCRPTPFATP